MQIRGSTRLAGILGYPVSHSLSPLMHNAAYAAMGLNLCYVPLPVSPEGLGSAIAGLRAMQFLGANVTIPHKVAVTGHLDRLAESARRVGAVNTIVNEDGSLVGHNTDGTGFIRALEEAVAVDYSGAPVLLLGAGGAARSVAMALADRGVPRIAIVNRGRARADELRQALKDKHPSLPVETRLLDADYNDLTAAAKIIINATPAGMSERLKSELIAVDSLSEEQIVCDLVYSQTQATPLLLAARAKGAKALGGLGMLIHQGAEAIRLWTGSTPPVEVMKEAIESQ